MPLYLPLLGPTQVASTGALPVGGLTGQALVKNSGTDLDVTWGSVVGKAAYSLTGANTLTQLVNSNAHGSWTGSSTAAQALPTTLFLGEYIEVTNDGSAPVTFTGVTAAPGFKNSALPGETFQAVSNGTIWRSVTPRTNSAINALTDGATITWDTDIGGIASVTLGGNRTLVINNPQDGGVYAIWITQDATGSRTMTLPANVKKAAADSLTLSTAANAVDYMVLTYNATKAIYDAAIKLNIA